MDLDQPPDAPDYDDLEDLLEELENDHKLVIDHPDIPSDIDDEEAAEASVTPAVVSGKPSTGPTQNNNAARPQTPGNKRQLEEIFGDLNGLEDSDEDAAPKRQKTALPKTSEDANMDSLMERIRNSRALPKMEQFVAGPGPESAAASRDRARISTRVLIGCNFQKMTFPDGTRYYLRVRGTGPQLVDSPVATGASLLSRPLQQLKDEARQLEERRRRLQQERQVLDKLATWQDEPAADSGVESDDESERSALWVERFQPRSYVELLSDESINRGLLHWMKLWDKAVFGRDVIIKPKEEKKKPDGKFKPFVRKPAFEVVEELDATNRPRQKVALLCGPPGLGKTTLAHVLARHAGYNVLEMNASDDRSLAAFRTALETATQMRPMLGSDPRPNCLVIDEIDGAPAPSINLLVTALSNSDGAGTGRARRQKAATAPIHRPVICICNDPYAPALRPLRQMALVMTFPPTSRERLAGRLADICRRNGLRTDLGALLSLCEKTRSDIRSCLSFLQFVRSRQDRLTLDQVQASTAGQKDHHKGLFAAWQEIFNIPRPKRWVARHAGSTWWWRRPAGRSGSPADGTSLAERFRDMVSLVASCGEYDKLALGMFENYLNAKIKDSSMNSVGLGADWLCFNDELSTELHHTQNYVLAPYQQYAGVAFHLLFGSLQRMRPAFPQAEAEVKQRLTKQKNLLATMVSDMAPRARCFNSASTLVLDMLPYLLQVAQPSLRPVNSQLHTVRETEELHRVLQLMIAYNLTYRQQRDDDGQYQYLLEPNMEELVYFGEQRPHRPVPYTVKQLVAREIELEKMRRAEAAVVGAETRQAVAAREAEQQQQKPEPPTPVPNHQRQQLKPRPIAERTVDDTAPRDFFGRVLQPRAAPQRTPDEEEASDAGRLLRTDVWYHFKEGYNNAVRRTVRVQDLA
ncbi:chromosome transmission fidelity protein 18 homolog [Pollicipes pollicipes]|uniref:chromosome transmission fidelity protein 18 homolog n=1 Tax=Pollicipes pollicipes TaxID=41117 RepID=UPI0018852929|nr:chromosome transmission fidelity protein 18 homolog [Pollicipes pollicipes]